MNTEDTNKILLYIKEEREKLNILEKDIKEEIEPICSNCKFWDISEKINNKRFSNCDIFNCIQSESKGYIEVTALDDTGLNIMFMTHESFGCNLFQTK